jgi:RNA polymerase sigma factor (TIGR02999 family)
MCAELNPTEALLAHSRGEGDPASGLFASIYDELRALAGHYMRQERRDHTLQPTALVHEAYLRLIDTARIDWQGKSHFFAVAATQMRRILADHARARRAAKRGGAARKLTLDDSLAMTRDGFLDALALDEALDRLTRESPRQSRVVELRFFGGLSVPETAHVLRVSEGTVKGDWRVARAWLYRELAASRSKDYGPATPPADL